MTTDGGKKSYEKVEMSYDGQGRLIKDESDVQETGIVEGESPLLLFKHYKTVTENL
jgi:hypothetical protein